MKRLAESDQSRAERESKDSVELSKSSTERDAQDLRSPLERFRTKPKKSLSVTDLVSPSWCELQYWYTLTKHGKKTRTPAMRQGTAVHKTLEDQIHRTVTVDLQTKEDAWGLKIWNTIQGLRGLRDTGMTRELGVWGVIDGLVVQGVIDELSYICPDRELEEASSRGTAIETAIEDTLPADQTSITDFWDPSSTRTNNRGMVKSLNSLVKKTSRVYLADVKTRGVKSIPTGASFRPTLIQLMLYHRLVSDLATNQTDVVVLFDRYGLDPNLPFSDTFIAEVGNLGEVFYDAPSDPDASDEEPSTVSLSSQDPMQVLLDHNSLHQLWAFMIEEFQRTMPRGADSVGSVLKVEYRAQSDGAIMGIKTFLYDHDLLQSYLDDSLRWWRGEREAQGVGEEEAYKCRSCEFADECTWRKGKIEEATQRHRARTRSVI